MRKSDSNRLIKALFMSLIFHIFLFTGMNFIDWFPEINSENKYLPLSVKIESYPVEKNEVLLESSVNKIPDIDNKPIVQSVSEVETNSVSSSSETVFDPYADLGMNNNSNISSSAPDLPDEGVRKTEYIPKGGNKIEYDDPVPDDGTITSESPGTADEVSKEPISSILSDEDIQNLEIAINRESNQSSSSSTSHTESDSMAFEYIDTPVEFDDPGVKREILTNPPPEIPDDLPPDFPPEITYSIRFRLNPDGLIQVLSMTHSLVYPKIDASIRKALRSWTFKGSESSEFVEGTITLIFKGK